MAARVFKGRVVHSKALGNLEVFENALLGVSEEGKVVFLANADTLASLKKEFNFEDKQVIDLGNKILIPGFIDTHTHAPQYVFTGTGTDLPLLDWLNKYTFPFESKCSDAKFALDTFSKAVRRHVMNGSTTCVYFSALHLGSTKILLDQVEKVGQRAFIGQTCMDRHSPDYYIKTTDGNMQDTKEFIETVSERKNPLVTPVITPRFAPSCTDSLMTFLGEISEKYNLPVQSHISENKNEVSWVKELYPSDSSYSAVYDRFKLLNSRTIMAHGVYLTEDELDLFKKREAAISHCPVSNFNLCSGTLCVRKVIEKGIKLGLGTDVSGGYSPSLLQTIRQAIAASNVTHLDNTSYKPLSWQEAFHLATVGGAQVVGMEATLGNFVPGKWFDALVVDPEVKNGPFDIFADDGLLETFQKFIFLGDDRNIVQVWVGGKQAQL